MSIGTTAIAGATIADSTETFATRTLTPDLTFSQPYSTKLKYRADQVDVAIDLANEFNSGEAIDRIDTLDITRLAEHTSVKSEFGSPSGQISGTEVRFRLDAPSNGQQAAGYYQIRVTVDTSESELTTAMDTNGDLPLIKVIDSADTSAP